jgi:hypothetical protein
MPQWLRRMLHRALDIERHSGYARRKTRRRALRPTDGRQPLRHFRVAGTSGVLRRAAAIAGHVR